MTSLDNLSSKPQWAGTDFDGIIGFRNQKWRLQAACADADPELFHPKRGENAKKARAFCRRCPVWRSCLAFAVEHNEIGIWAGTTEKQRRPLRKQYRAQYNRGRRIA